MPKRIPQFAICADLPQVLVIRDTGPWDEYPTITNGVEDVVRYLLEHGKIGTRQLWYYDSEGELAEILYEGDRGFVGFHSPSLPEITTHIGEPHVDEYYLVGGETFLTKVGRERLKSLGWNDQLIDAFMKDEFVERDREPRSWQESD